MSESKPKEDKVDPKDLYKLLNDLKQKLEANKIGIKHSKSLKEAR